MEKNQNEDKQNATNPQIIKIIAENQKVTFYPKLSTTILQSCNSYVNFNITKNHPQISRSSFPYYLEDEVDTKINKRKKRMNIKITNRVRIEQKQGNNLNTKNQEIEKEQPPVNQYLCYDLSEQITNGIYDVKILAEEIKQIKQKKQVQIEDKQKYKPTNKIRIKQTAKIRGSWLRGISNYPLTCKDKSINGFR